MRLIFITVITALLAGCAITPDRTDSDPIDRLIVRLSSSHGLWTNGLFPIIKLPATASNEEIVSKVLERQVANYRILKVRQIYIEGGAYTAALVQTNDGDKIVLFNYGGSAVGWWSRIYDAKTST